MTTVDLIRVSGMLFNLNMLGIEDNNDPKCLVKEPWMFRGFKLEKQRIKVENALS